MQPDLMLSPAPIAPQVYQARRARLMHKLPSHSAALIPGASLVTRSRDSEYPFRQDSDFYYLTGITEPDALLVLLPDGSDQGGQCVVFCQDRDPTMEAWTGRRLGAEGVMREHAVELAFENAEREEQLKTLLSGCEMLYIPLSHPEARGLADDAYQQAQAAQRRGHPTLQGWLDIAPLIHDMRLIKGDEELALLRHAAAISARAHCRVMRTAAPGLHEYHLQAELEHEFVWQGGSGPAYSTIVGSGANACVLHYIENSALLKAGELVLIDAGAEYALYAGDITRTFPVSGVFSAPQRALYSLVLEAQKNAVAAVCPGATLHEIHQGVVRDLTQGLIALGLLKGELDECIKNESYRRFYLHSTSHWLGLDVHDVGAYRLDPETSCPLEPGMVITVEPGLYIPDDEDIPADYRSIGIRIEDDVVVTAEGHEVITSDVPKEIADIEALMADK
ncbi:Xaa-Pro aminopeptidase [Halomonas sp. TBZ9]|uniref:Xaa-Pro aminopeptidase n=1 Tax=Vreelandella azerica TaxID=2732867 RepID=A0A7Y3TYR8_9GAMM|nr:Xaa-Pro aminopeptidase [Halomonas azerica]NOG32721.1 Xaa-Pro aminopeptidase [Halomonas azerica]